MSRAIEATWRGGTRLRGKDWFSFGWQGNFSHKYKDLLIKSEPISLLFAASSYVARRDWLFADTAY